MLISAKTLAFALLVKQTTPRLHRIMKICFGNMNWVLGSEFALLELTVLEVGLKIQRFNKSKIRQFPTCWRSCRNTLWFVKNWLNEGVEDAPSKVSLRLPIGETFSREANGTRGA